MRSTIFTLTLIFALSMFAGQAFAGDDHEDIKPVTVSEHHEVLHAGVGTWKVVQKSWHAPGAEPMIGEGTSVCEKILDGQATVVRVETRNDHGVFKGFGIFTWNTLTKKYEASWIDIFSFNGVDSMQGSYDKETGTMTWTSEMTMPNGAKLPFEMVEKRREDGAVVAEFYMPGKDGKMFKMMENTYTKME